MTNFAKALKAHRSKLSKEIARWGRTAAPKHELTAAERKRFADEMAERNAEFFAAIR